MDIQDFRQVSSNGNRYPPAVVDRTSKFFFGYPLASKGALEASRKLMELILKIKSDGGEEFTAQVVGHWYRWLNVTLTHGPADFARSQGAENRMGGWFQEALSILCQKWPLRWDHFVLLACWIQRVTPDLSLSAKMTPFCILFGRDARTQIDMMTLSIDGAESRGGLANVVADKHQAFVEVRDVLDKRPVDKDKARNALNAQFGRGSPGRHAKVGDQVMVKKAHSSLSRPGIHPKLSHDHWTAPWTVVSIPRPESSLVVNLNGCSIRRRTVGGERQVLVPSAGRPAPRARRRVCTRGLGTRLGSGRSIHSGVIRVHSV